MHGTAAAPYGNHGSHSGQGLVLMTGREMRRLRDLKQVADLTLAEALHVVSERRWKKLRSYKTSMGQARKGLEDLTLIMRPDLANESPERRNEMIRHHEVKQEHVSELVGQWRDADREATLINRRLVCFSVLMLPSTGHYQRIPRKLKWWLKPDAEEIIVTRLRSYCNPIDTLVADYIEWTTRTGLRVEESLRLRRADFTITGNNRVLVTVAGTKTIMAQMTLPLLPAAADIFRRRLGHDAAPDARLFPISYDHLCNKWRECRGMIGATRIQGATLKALRRTAARHLHLGQNGKGGLPLDACRHYLRHDSIETTISYLRLTGGYSADELSQFIG